MLVKFSDIPDFLLESDLYRVLRDNDDDPLNIINFPDDKFTYTDIILNNSDFKLLLNTLTYFNAILTDSIYEYIIQNKKKALLILYEFEYVFDDLIEDIYETDYSIDIEINTKIEGNWTDINYNLIVRLGKTEVFRIGTLNFDDLSQEFDEFTSLIESIKIKEPYIFSFDRHWNIETLGLIKHTFSEFKYENNILLIYKYTTSIVHGTILETIDDDIVKFAITINKLNINRICNNLKKIQNKLTDEFEKALNLRN